MTVDLSSVCIAVEGLCLAAEALSGETRAKLGLEAPLSEIIAARDKIYVIPSADTPREGKPVLGLDSLPKVLYYCPPDESGLVQLYVLICNGNDSLGVSFGLNPASGYALLGLHRIRAAENVMAYGYESERSTYSEAFYPKKRRLQELANALMPLNVFCRVLGYLQVNYAWIDLWGEPLAKTGKTLVQPQLTVGVSRA